MNYDTRTLIIDIETAAERFDTLDELTQKEVLKTVKTDPKDTEGYEAEIEKTMALSPLLGSIITLGVYDVEKNIAKVYFDPGEHTGKTIEEFKEGNSTFTPMEERAMLERFWAGVRNYSHIVTFNGRGFDIPYIMVRSGVREVQPSIDLMGQRYLSTRQSPPHHIDLLDQLRSYNAAFYRCSLHLAARAFGIASPKADEISGEQITKLFYAGKHEDIARYNARDLISTAKLYEYWHHYINFVV